MPAHTNWSDTIQFNGNTILLDIEGTTSSISYVFDTMFPYVREHLDSFLRENWTQPGLNEAIEQLAKEAGLNLPEWIDSVDPAGAQQVIASKVNQLMDDDIKSTGLKNLQGQIWKSGFESGQLVGHLFGDVAPAIHTWKAAGKKVCIYSSGSIAAQKLYFGHSDAGDLLPNIDGHFDTTIGNKRETASYQAIVDQLGIAAGRILFISDVVAELNAAREAGMQTVLSIRAGNPPADINDHPALTSFSEIKLVS